MSVRAHFRAMLSERRAYEPGSEEWLWRTRAATKYAVLLGRMDASRWPK